MAFIYVITNKINGRQYVGKTNQTVERRFKQHIKDRTRFCDRPLYRAINKYGPENFFVETLEECSEEESANLEIYWIGKLDTYKNGYNATLGGEGKSVRDYKVIADKYKELQSQIAVADFFHCDRKTVRIACEKYGIHILSSGEHSRLNNGKAVQMLDKKTLKVLHTFENMSDAGRFLNEKILDTPREIKNISCSIGRVLKGRQKTACGFAWKAV